MVDFNMKVTKYYYYSIGDLISSLGGISAATKPVLDLITPIIMLYFFNKVAGIIQESYTIAYKDQLWESL